VALEQEFKIMWADHGDDISRQYAGTGGEQAGCRVLLAPLM
jgi:hypothetical protein